MFPVECTVKMPLVRETGQLTNSGGGEVFPFVFSEGDYPPRPVHSEQRQGNTVIRSWTGGLPHTQSLVWQAA